MDDAAFFSGADALELGMKQGLEVESRTGLSNNDHEQEDDTGRCHQDHLHHQR
jgi:hypothetical protein